MLGQLFARSAATWMVSTSMIEKPPMFSLDSTKGPSVTTLALTTRPSAVKASPESMIHPFCSPSPIQERHFSMCFCISSGDILLNASPGRRKTKRNLAIGMLLCLPWLRAALAARLYWHDERNRPEGTAILQNSAPPHLFGAAARSGHHKYPMLEDRGFQ